MSLYFLITRSNETAVGLRFFVRKALPDFRFDTFRQRYTDASAQYSILFLNVVTIASKSHFLVEVGTVTDMRARDTHHQRRQNAKLAFSIVASNIIRSDLTSISSASTKIALSSSASFAQRQRKVKPKKS